MRNLTAILAIFLGLTSCSPDCVQLCEDGKDECNDLELDCEDFCDAAQEIAEDEGCEEDLDDWLECLDDADDLSCDTWQDECGDEGDDFEDCAQEYCEDHPSSSSCNDLEGE